MAPIEVQAILQYASNYISSLTYMNGQVPVLTGTGLITATLLMLIFTVINIMGYKGLARFNSLLFFIKVTIIVIAIGMIAMTKFHSDNFRGLLPSALTVTSWQAILTAVAAGGVAFAFTGFKHGVELAGEAKQFVLAIPLAIIGSIVICLILYLGLQVSFIGALEPSTIKHGWQSLTFPGDMGPLAGLAGGLGLIWLVKLLYVDAILSPAGAGLIYMTSTARILFAMSQIGYLPKWLSYLNRHQFPVVAIWVNFFLGMFLFLPLPGWQAMVSFLVSGMVISYAIGPIALLCMRIELPEKPRPFRLPLAHIICPLAFYFCNLLSYWCGWDTIWKLAVAIVIGLAVFSLIQLRTRNRYSHLGLKSLVWLGPYFIGLVLISYLGAFGGKHIIPFGADFIVIGLFSLVIFYLAIKSRISFSEAGLLPSQRHPLTEATIVETFSALREQIETTRDHN